MAVDSMADKIASLKNSREIQMTTKKSVSDAIPEYKADMAFCRSLLCGTGGDTLSATNCGVYDVYIRLMMERIALQPDCSFSNLVPDPISTSVDAWRNKLLAIDSTTGAVSGALYDCLDDYSGDEATTDLYPTVDGSPSTELNVSSVFLLKNILTLGTNSNMFMNSFVAQQGLEALYFGNGSEHSSGYCVPVTSGSTENGGTVTTTYTYTYHSALLAWLNAIKTMVTNWDSVTYNANATASYNAEGFMYTYMETEKGYSLFPTSESGNRLPLDASHYTLSLNETDKTALESAIAWCGTQTDGAVVSSSTDIDILQKLVYESTSSSGTYFDSHTLCANLGSSMDARVSSIDTELEISSSVADLNSKVYKVRSLFGTLVRLLVDKPSASLCVYKGAFGVMDNANKEIAKADGYVGSLVGVTDTDSWLSAPSMLGVYRDEDYLIHMLYGMLPCYDKLNVQVTDFSPIVTTIDDITTTTARTMTLLATDPTTFFSSVNNLVITDVSKINGELYDGVSTTVHDYFAEHAPSSSTMYALRCKVIDNKKVDASYVTGSPWSATVSDSVKGTLSKSCVCWDLVMASGFESVAKGQYLYDSTNNVVWLVSAKQGNRSFSLTLQEGAIGTSYTGGDVNVARYPSLLMPVS